MKRVPSLSLLALLAAPGLAQTCGPFSLTVVSPDTAGFSCSQVGSSNTWNFTLTASSDANSDGRIECLVQVTQSARSIGTATLINTLGSGIELQVRIEGGSPSTLPVDVGSVVRTGSNSPVHLEFLETSGDLASISVDSIGTVVVGDDLTGDAHATTGDFASLTVLGAIAGGATIRANNGSIGLISVPTVDGSNSDLGAVNNPVAISAGVQINDIYVYDDIWAYITVDGGEGPVGRIENEAGGIGGGSGDTTWDFGGFANISARGPEGFYCAGNFHGPLTIDADLTEPIEIAGLVDADITITGNASTPITIGGDLDADLVIAGVASSSISVNDLGNMSPAITGNVILGTNAVGTAISAQVIIEGSLRRGEVKSWQPFSGLVNIGGSIDSDGTVFFEDGFSGQVIVNSLNSSGTWSGAVKYGSSGTTITGGPYYTTTASTWGGGAVGLVPFHLHEESCDPPAGGTVGTVDEVTLTFYGPVSWSQTPVHISQCTGNCPDDPDATSSFTFSGSGTRFMILTYTPGTFPSNTTFHVTPATGVLKSHGIMAGSSVGADESWSYTFSRP